MSYEERHAISTAWIEAMEWQLFYQRCGEITKAERWARRAAKFKMQILSENPHA
jgi:hypothetical protein